MLLWAFGYKFLFFRQVFHFVWTILISASCDIDRLHGNINICLAFWKWKWKSPICVQFFATTWTIQSMEFSRPEYWRSLSLPHGIFPTQELNQGLLHCRQVLYQLNYKKVLNFLRNCQTLFHSRYTILHFYPPMYQGFAFSISSLTFVTSLFDHRYPSVWTDIVVLIYISLMPNDI